MRLVLKYAKRTESGSFIYRRRVPQDILGVIGKREFKPPLGDSEATAVRVYPRVHDYIEKQIASARRALAQEQAAVSGGATAVQRYEAARRSVEDMLAQGYSGLTEDGARDIIAEGIAAKYPVDRESGYPVGVSEFDRERLRLLSNPKAVPPRKTLGDAKHLYIRERLGGGQSAGHKKDVQRVERMVGYVQKALGRDPELEALTRDDGRIVRDFMLALTRPDGKAKKPSSIKREINQLKAIINFAIEEFELTGRAINPFTKIEIPGLDAEADDEQRDPLPEDVLLAVRGRMLTRAKPELGLIWRLLEGTGCRLAEITGLRVEDVTVTGDLPNIRVTWHEERRVKTKASRRYVPLVGDALLAAGDALALQRRSPMLFPSYGREGGPGAASNALMGHLRTVSENPRHVVHSLRHNMKDRLIDAEVQYLDQNLILGHALGGVGDRVYGGAPAKLRATTRAMKKALGID